MNRDEESLAQVHRAVPVFPVKDRWDRISCGLVCLLVGEDMGQGKYIKYASMETALSKIGWPEHEFVSPSHPVAPLFGRVHSVLVKLWSSSKNPEFHAGQYNPDSDPLALCTD